MLHPSRTGRVASKDITSYYSCKQQINKTGRFPSFHYRRPHVSHQSLYHSKQKGESTIARHRIIAIIRINHSLQNSQEIGIMLNTVRAHNLRVELCIARAQRKQAEHAHRVNSDGYESIEK
jgi:hypothetical protein